MTETTSGSARAHDAPRVAQRLRMDRLYTTPGVHPYDEVTWERRDVVLTNWRDGSVNFEQRGVEFPDFWSVNAANIVTTKYFRGAVGTPQRESSLRQLVDRVVSRYVAGAREFGYLTTETELEVFDHELTWMLLHQVFSFNSPVWFNVGTSAPQQVSACFILAVDDTMDSILNWYKEEGLIFKGGSGAGLNLSRIRSSKELLSSGGTASGPVSFMRGADASAGTIKSGGATRRAAKMVVLDIDHPDVEEFIETKAREEEKIRALRDAGFDMDLGGRDIASVQYQNANNSVRVSDEFMRAVEAGGEFALRGRLDGSVVETVDARSLFTKVAQAAWACADPGIQYDDTINDWHTNPETGRITASNPCFPADQRVLTDVGLVAIGDLVARAAGGQSFRVYTHDATSQHAPADRLVASAPERYLVTGTNEVLELRFSDGSRLRCTPNHRVWTRNRGWVRADELAEADAVTRSLEPAERPFASWRLPVDAADTTSSPGSVRATAAAEKWTSQLASYLGRLTGDGYLSGNAVTTGYGGGDATQLLRALGVTDEDAAAKRVPWSVFEAPTEVVSAFLRGLFDADGYVVDQEATGRRYVALDSHSEELLLDVQELLASVGVAASIRRRPSHAGEDVRKDGTRTETPSGCAAYDLRISGRSIGAFARTVGFELPGKAALLAHVAASRARHDDDESVRLVSRVGRGFETTYNLTEPRNHSYVVSGVVVSNCSEYLSLDNSSCNLASLNLLKFLRPDSTFDAKSFAKAVEIIVTAMDVSISFADFPTEKIGETTRAFRQLGIGYANLGALLMAVGLPYDSEGGRTMAAAITSLMTGTAYKRSAEMAGVVGTYDGYERNASAHQRVMRKHAAANDAIRAMGAEDLRILHEATKSWQDCLATGERNGWRNAQASVLAPTGCLTGDSLVASDRGLTRLGEVGDVYGSRWQALSMTVSTDAGPRMATRFFVNGEEPTRRITTTGGYVIQGTLAHRVRVVDPASGSWVWRRLADIQPGDIAPLQLASRVGEPRQVVLPLLAQACDAGDLSVGVPEAVDADLAELVGYFMGAGSLQAEGLRFCVGDDDFDVVERIRILSKDLFHLEPVVRQAQGCQEVSVPSVRLAGWWSAAGFAERLPQVDHTGRGRAPRVPSALLETNDPQVYAAFLRGLFEADGAVSGSVPSLSTASESFAAEVRTLLLTLGIASTTRATSSERGGRVFQLRARNLSHARLFADLVGFPGSRKQRRLFETSGTQSGNRDRIQLPAQVWLEAAPAGSSLRRQVKHAVASGRGVSRELATRLFQLSADTRISIGLGYLYEEVASNEDGGIQPTYDLSVPSNVTYVAGGFVSHNTIGLMMDCDTTGIEPDLALVKIKKLVGGASMNIVNQTVPSALRMLGYTQETVEAVVEYIATHGKVVDAPGLKPEHYAVFDCAMGERSIASMGHVRMMAAVQPFISGGISKTCNLPESATVADVADIYFQGWKLGLKALAIYRDNCKVGQPLSDLRGARAEVTGGAAAAGPVRRRLPKKRPSQTVSFSVAGAEGYLTASNYPDDGLGEVFLKMSKQGSTLAGVMDAFSMAISIGLQYGVPLETWVAKFTNMRFEPAGMTDDPDVRIAHSVLDYIFRRLALDNLPYEKRAELGIFTAAERAAAVSTSYNTAVEEVAEDLDALAGPAPAPAPRPAGSDESEQAAVAREEFRSGGSAGQALASQTAVDAPLCMTCGVKMRPAGSCYVCESCGSTSGCS